MAAPNDRTHRTMRPHLLIGSALALLAAFDLPAQGRGRRGQRPDGAPQPAAAPSEAAPAAKAEAKPKKHTAIVGGDVYLGTGQRLDPPPSGKP